MNREQLKQRIVGAIVLVALGVIFIPMILNRDTANSDISASNIPTKPEVLTQLSQQPMPSPPPVPAKPAETRTLVDKDTPPLPQASPESADTPAPKPVIKPADKPTASVSKPDTTHGWVVQLASFTARKTALRLRDRVRKAGYTCYVEAISGKRGTLYRVRVGPVIKRQEAERLQKKITRQFKLKGTLIMSHP